MKLEHVNLVVSDINAMLKFYQAAFSYWSIRSGGNCDLSGHQVGLAHFAYVTNNLNAVIARLKHAGFAISKEGAVNPFRKKFYYIDPAGFEVEFVEYMSDVPSERNNDL